MAPEKGISWSFGGIEERKKQIPKKVDFAQFFVDTFWDLGTFTSCQVLESFYYSILYSPTLGWNSVDDKLVNLGETIEIKTIIIFWGH